MASTQIIQENGLAALHRLLNIARRGTGQSKTVANFLLAWWNAESCGGWDLTDLWGVDATIADDMLAVVAFVANHREYPGSHGFQEEFEGLVMTWRPHLFAACG